MTSSFADGSHIFLEHVHSLWKHGAGEGPPPNTTSDGAPAEVVKGKFRGKFEWAFSFPFPSQFTYFGKRKGSEATEYTTPQTLMERSVHATIIYEVIVKVAAGLFRNKHKFVFFHHFCHPTIAFPLHFKLCSDLRNLRLNQDHCQCPLRALADKSGNADSAKRSLPHRTVSVQSFGGCRGMVGFETSPHSDLHQNRRWYKQQRPLWQCGGNMHCMPSTFSASIRVI